MPLGFERLNERQQRPNALINFIKPLETADKATAQDFLQRVAAQCYPVMKKHHLSVMSLEEHEPNAEFLGRNFNAGEVIQLVLKDRAGRWLSFKYVQMVMMHELAHCKQMNHSRFFWAVRNEYATQMEGLWQDGYSGEGLWGRGRGLSDGAFVHDRAPDSSAIPQHLCGGTYRRRGRKRKRGTQNTDHTPQKLSYAERQQRRIAKKFGVHGEGAALGENDLLRGALETMQGGKRHYGKPRVANSKRGRELRAAAALARFNQAENQKSLDRDLIKQEDDDSDTESESGEEDMDSSADHESRDIITDGDGRDLVKVCGDEEGEDSNGLSKERSELALLLNQGRSRSKPEDSRNSRRVDSDSGTESGEDSRSELLSNKSAIESSKASSTLPGAQNCSRGQVGAVGKITHDRPQSGKQSRNRETGQMQDSHPNPTACPICSLENEPDSATCTACAHVLRPSLMPNHWRCTSKTCQGSKYVNAGDVGLCGICGTAQ